jgi:hypothetical protein
MSQHKVVFSGKKSELFAQIVFSVLNKAFLPTAETFSHRVNIIAKLIRDKQWTTPKGFYKHFDIGIAIKLEQEQKETTRLAKKSQEKLSEVEEGRGCHVAYDSNQDIFQNVPLAANELQTVTLTKRSVKQNWKMSGDIKALKQKRSELENTLAFLVGDKRSLKTLLKFNQKLELMDDGEVYTILYKLFVTRRKVKK